jgi:hypothetical protein
MRVVLMIIVTILVVFSCRKSAPETVLPLISNNGTHTIGFFLNSEIWIPYDRGKHEQYELPKPTLDKDGHLKISATRIDEKISARNWFCIEIDRGCKSPGSYPISSKSCKSPYQTYYYGRNKNRKEDIYSIDTLQPHFIEVLHLDTINQIISGTFQFDAFTQAGDSIKVRSGRFDLKYED